MEREKENFKAFVMVVMSKDTEDLNAQRKKAKAKAMKQTHGIKEKAMNQTHGIRKAVRKDMERTSTRAAARTHGDNHLHGINKAGGTMAPEKEDTSMVEDGTPGAKKANRAKGKANCMDAMADTATNRDSQSKHLDFGTNHWMDHTHIMTIKHILFRMSVKKIYLEVSIPLMLMM